MGVVCHITNLMSSLKVVICVKCVYKKMLEMLIDPHVLTFIVSILMKKFPPAQPQNTEAENK